MPLSGGSQQALSRLSAGSHQHVIRAMRKLCWSVSKTCRPCDDSRSRHERSRRTLLCRRERDQGNADEHKESYAYELVACNHVAKCLQPHNTGMSKAGPCGKGDQATIRPWVANCQQQENAE